MFLTSFSTSAQTFFCAYEGPDGQKAAIKAKLIINETEVELVNDIGLSFSYTILFNKKQLLLAAMPVYEKKRGRLVNPGIDTLSLIIPTKGQAKNGARTQIKLGRVITGLPDWTSVGTCM